VSKVSLARLRGGLIVSCQPVTGGPLDRPDIVAAFALAALAGGAVGLRIQGAANLAAVRAVTDAPVIGLVKVDLDDSPVRITPLIEHVTALAEAGADVIAVDATDRPRPVPLVDLLAAIHNRGLIAMADCASAAEARHAADLGFEVLGTTMSGHVGGPVPQGPDLDLVADLARMGRFVIAEGRYQTPLDAAAAIKAGADAVVAGSAITRPEHITAWFVAAIAGKPKPEMPI
jgi:putative N-acetylmannosamine-6-phosphate epimerase